ncbi:MAG: ABC transporter transmembrane domain-containing protein, partial [Herbiconiux sp.]|nr:ABC transporter transmembrane domain-containing protein [Herbiconiux sp.]
GPDFVPVRHRERSVWRDYLAPARQAWRRVLGIMALSLLVFAAGLVAPALTRWLIDQQVSGEAVSWPATAFLGVGGFAISLLALSVGRALVVTSLTVHVGRATMRRVFGHLLGLPYRYFASRSPGELLFRLNSVNAVRDLVSTHLAQGALDLGMSAALLAYMLYLSPPLTAVAAGFYVVIVAILVLTRRRVGELLDSEMTHTSRSQSMQLESVVAAAALRMSGSEERYFGEWGGTYEKALAANQRRANLQGLITSAVTSLQVVAPTAVFLVGLHEIADGSTSLGTVVAFQAVASMFFGLATSVFGCWTQLVQGRSYLTRISDIVEMELPVRDGTCEVALAGQVDVRGVSFRYSRGGEDAIADVDLTVRPGERVAVVGASGSGKSTLGKVLCGLFEPTQGTLTYDGRPIGAYERTHFYSRVGYVPQEVHLLNRTLLENITMGRSDLTEADARSAAGAAQIAEEIEALPMGYQTLVAEMGANFS